MFLEVSLRPLPLVNSVLPPARNQYGLHMAYAAQIDDPAEKRMYSHGGGAGGFRTVWIIATDTQQAWVVLLSSSEGKLHSITLHRHA